MSYRGLVARLVMLLFVGALSACGVPADMDEPTRDMGDFALGHNIAVANEPQIGAFSRTATDEEWEAAMKAAMIRRFDVYEGERLVNVGIKINAYALAWPGIPVLFTPTSILAVSVTIWDDEKQKKLNPEPKEFTIFEGISGDTLIGSGLLNNKDEQMVILTDNVAKAIQDWILQNPQWVGLPPLSDEQQLAADAVALAAQPPAADGTVIVPAPPLPADQSAQTSN